MKFFVNTLIILTFLSCALSQAQNRKQALNPIAFEHIHINVKDMKASAQWYATNVGLEIIPVKDKDIMCVADKDHNFMIEFSQKEGIRNSYHDIDLNAYHLAFEGHKTIEAVGSKMLENGATQLGDIYRNKVGDFVLNLKDINGFSAQLIYRVNPFYPKPIKSTIRFEHFAFNTQDQKADALWFVQFMNLTIPWSKDIDSVTKERNFRVPYIGDKGNNMSFEMYAKDVPCSLCYESHDVIHIAFTCDDPVSMAQQMVFGGATQVSKKLSTTSGDIFIDLYDPRGIPIRLIKRENPVL